MSRRRTTAAARRGRPVPRARLKRLVVMVATVLCTALVGVGIKLVDVAVNDWMGLTAHDSGNMGQSARWFGRNHRLNVTEPWLAHYNSGTAAFGEQRWQNAEEHYRRALELAPPQHRCTVALNLAWSMEARADALKAGGNLTEAQEHWARAGKVVEQNHCPRPEKDKANQQKDPKKKDPQEQKDKKKDGEEDETAADPTQPEGKPEDQQQKTRHRLQGKQKEAEQKTGKKPQQPPPENEETQQQRQEQLEKMKQKAAEEAMRARDLQRKGKEHNESEGKQGPDRPW